MIKHILVDGWNLIHSDKELKNILMEYGQEAARASLAQKLAPLHDISSERLSIVYDGKGDDIQISRFTEILSFSEIFTPKDMTADELIEQLCSANKDKKNDIIVVSNDNLLALTGKSFGAIHYNNEFAIKLSKECHKSISLTTKNLNKKIETIWKKNNPFYKIDILNLDPNSIRKTPLISKRLKKKLKRNALKDKNL